MSPQFYVAISITRPQFQYIIPIEYNANTLTEKGYRNLNNGRSCHYFTRLSKSPLRPDGVCVSGYHVQMFSYASVKKLIFLFLPARVMCKAPAKHSKANIHSSIVTFHTTNTVEHIKSQMTKPQSTWLGHIG